LGALSPWTRLAFLSAQTQRQIEIGLEVARLAKEDVQDGNATTALLNVMKQSLSRNDGWREYYKEEMKAMATPTPNLVALSTFELERAAELKFQDGDIDGAIAIVQKLGNEAADPSEQGWYVQESERRSLRGRVGGETTKVEPRG
jgi:hypothetical protein